MSISLLLVLASGSDHLLLDTGPGVGYIGINGMGPSQLFTNPAAITATGIDINHTEWLQSIRYDNLSYANRIGHSYLAFGINGLYTSGIEKRSGPTPNPEGRFGVYFLTPAIGCQIGIKSLSLGATSKLIYERIAEYQGFGGAVDLGSQLDLNQIRISLVVANLGVGPKLADSRSNLPVAFKGGVGINLIDPLTFAIELSKVRGYDLGLRVGVSFAPLDYLRLNGGYYRDGILMGLDLSLGRIGISYSYRSLDLGHSQSLGLRFRPRVEAFGDVDRFFAQALEAYRNGEWDQVITLLDLVLLLKPDHQKASKLLSLAEAKRREQRIDSLTGLGTDALSRKDYLEAMAIFTQILRIDPENEAARENRAQALSLLSAEMEMRSEVMARVRDALSYYSKGDYGHALRLLREARMLDPENEEIIRYLDEVGRKQKRVVEQAVKRIEGYLKVGKAGRALYLVNEALRTSPGDTTLLRLKRKITRRISSQEQRLMREAIQLYTQGKKKEAAELFGRVLSLNPNNRTAHNYLTRIGADEDPEEYHTLGIKAYLRGDFELAIRYWEMVLEIDPDHRWARRNIERARKKLATISARP